MALNITVGQDSVFISRHLKLFEEMPSYIQIIINYEVTACGFQHQIHKIDEKGLTHFLHMCFPYYLRNEDDEKEHVAHCDQAGRLLTVNESKYEKNSFEEFFFRAFVKSEVSGTILADLVRAQPDSFPWARTNRRAAVTATREKQCL